MALKGHNGKEKVVVGSSSKEKRLGIFFFAEITHHNESKSPKKCNLMAKIKGFLHF